MPATKKTLQAHKNKATVEVENDEGNTGGKDEEAGTDLEEGSNDEDVEVDDDGCKIDWKADHYSWFFKLISAISDNPQIKNGLYSPPGAHTSIEDGGNVTKTDAHRMLHKASSRPSTISPTPRMECP
ncbi:hypothetical protein PENSPDRAFT_695482 [Peniophora sp. CONT]|nr:hypothetical protein PENSPDRAFT_695482 [Peniophora sp. CONT]